MRKLTIEFVRKEFEKEGYVLLSKKYINSNHKLEYRCSNGHIHSILWTNWYRGKRCPYCVGQGKPTIEFIEKEFEKEDYTLLSKIYKNNQQKLNYICSEGHTHNITWNNWQRGRRCYYCFGTVKLTVDFIKREFEKEGYTLLTNKYKNAKQKLEYICSEEHKYYTTWDSWQQGSRCFVCRYVNFSGPAHPNWKGGISCEPYCHEWSFKEFKEYIKDRDGNKCLNPDCFGNLCRLGVHHIDYNKKNCVPQNLITLCASCNSRANKDREWHKAWYETIVYRRYTT